MKDLDKWSVPELLDEHEALARAIEFMASVDSDAATRASGALRGVLDNVRREILRRTESAS